MSLRRPRKRLAPVVAPGFILRRFAIALCLGALLGAPLPAAAAEPIDLIGTWFVLIHYRDSATANPDSDRWEDKVWKFEQKGSRLVWSEYPIVVFSDGSGRFGRVGRNPRARLLHKWEPNESQMDEIHKGPRVNSRGSKTKSLRGSPKRGYKSSHTSRSTSALTVGYVETWTIDEPTTLPIFTRDDALGTEADLATSADTVVSGRTRYATRELLDGGNVLVGSYARDENKRGTFRLIRAGDARGLESDGRSPNQKAQERRREQIRAGMADAAYAGFLQALGDDQVRDLRKQIGEEKLSEIWGRYEKRIIAGDESSRVEIGDDLRSAYMASVEQELRAVLASRNPDALLAGEEQEQGFEVDSRQLALIRKLRETLGDEKIAALRAKYDDPVRAGDEQAREALREEIREAYSSSVREDFQTRQNEAARQAEEKSSQSRLR
jgi:hypothetical protein